MNLGNLIIIDGETLMTPKERYDILLKHLQQQKSIYVATEIKAQTVERTETKAKLKGIDPNVMQELAMNLQMHKANILAIGADIQTTKEMLFTAYEKLSEEERKNYENPSHTN